MAQVIGPAWRWMETGPWGLIVHCAEAVWVAKTRHHPDIAAHEAAVRGIVRNPDLVFDDPRSTASLKPAGGREGASRHYIGRNRLPGHPAALVSVVVKVLRNPVTGESAGYVQTMYRTGRILPRLQLHGSRQP